jgi:anti-sigma B factor antagonist
MKGLDGADGAVWSERGPLSIRCERELEGTYVVELCGELDLAGIEFVADELARVEESDAVRILVDLSGLEFADSAGLRVLLQAAQRSAGNSGRLTFLRPQGAVARVMSLTQMDTLLPFDD